ncbi:uncharacterized protein LOC129757197 [Uranotaenia lowii]|uniref:uncharacterized protein LOC129755958 n=1 Tax=Uranotaenia lowii TaxID=190385 RepID=UPI00247A0BB1|nr:uncharacterized protein LOC129755958 [Uranotaenia lowii]XP_055610306.1 uncharacterized protein LOC129757197 [Uranotaenia lowii]
MSNMEHNNLPDWNTNETYRPVPQMELAEDTKNPQDAEKKLPHRIRNGSSNMFSQSIFDLTLITINICQICYILKVGPELGILYYIMLGLLGVSLFLLCIHGFMGLFGRLRCSSPLSDSCFNCLYNTSLFMVVLVYLVNLIFNVLSLKETEEKCQIIVNNIRNRSVT